MCVELNSDSRFGPSELSIEFSRIFSKYWGSGTGHFSLLLPFHSIWHVQLDASIVPPFCSYAKLVSLQHIIDRTSHQTCTTVAFTQSHVRMYKWEYNNAASCEAEQLQSNDLITYLNTQSLKACSLWNHIIYGNSQVSYLSCRCMMLRLEPGRSVGDA